MTETVATAPAEAQWARKQAHLTDLSTGLTAAGATALGLGLAGKTKAAGKVLPKRLHRDLQSSKGDDVRNSVALASMVAGTASGVNWSKKLRRDADPEKAAMKDQEKALNLAKAMDVGEGLGALDHGPASRRCPEHPQSDTSEPCQEDDATQADLRRAY